MGSYMSRPNLTKKSNAGDNSRLKYGVSSMQGWRHSMEDAHIARLDLTPELSLFGVFDGHGGQEVAKFCEKFFPQILLQSEHFAAGKYKEALQETYLKMDEMLASEASLDVLKEFSEERFAQMNAGTTAIVVLLTKTHIYVANAGDSRAYLACTNDNIWPLSTDHKPELEGEVRRIRNAGGYIMEGRVNSVLNLSRAIGDLDFKRNSSLGPQDQIITSFPDVLCIPIPADAHFIIIGCDGIWETMPISAMCSLVKKRLNENRCVKLSTICEELLDKLVAKDVQQGTGCDNMTVILVKFKDLDLHKLCAC